MIINSEILNLLRKFKIREEEGLCYLLCLFYRIELPSFIPISLTEKMLLTNIFVYEDKKINWIVSLWEQENTQFDWVEKEYIPLFTSLGKTPYKKECLDRMKKFFFTYPDIRKEEVIDATKLYIRRTENKFIRQPHYFISKGVGVQTISDLLQYVYIYRESIKTSSSTFIGNKLQ